MTLYCPECGRSYAGGERICPADGAALRADATVAVPARIDGLVGRVLDDKYQIDARLGEGGMGTVYRATHLLIERPVAVKVLHPRFVEDGDAQQRFRREARAAGRLRHPNAVAVTDFGSTPDGYVYIVMELLEGRTLREVLSEEAPLNFGRALSLMSQAAAAVEAAHEAGVIHRDLKPGNIFVVRRRGDSQPTVKVLDFGIAKLAVDSTDDSDAKNLTLTGVMIGTPRYMSPEQCDGEKLTPASDVYSLGLILYEMLTGATPFNGPTPLSVALQHSTKPPRPPRELVPAIPEELEGVVLRALAKNPAVRPADAGEFRRELFETARRLGVDLGSVTFADEDHGNAVAVVAGVSDSDSEGSGGNEAGDGETPSGRLVIDLEKMRDERDAAGAWALADAESSEVTLVARRPERANTATAPPAVAAVESSSLRARDFTRVEVLMKRGRPWREWLGQPPVLVAALLALLVASVVAVGLMGSTVTDGTAADTAENVAATPQPSPLASASATPEEPRAKPPQRARRATRPAAKPARRKPSGGNRVKKVLKKIFNPF